MAKRPFDLVAAAFFAAIAVLHVIRLVTHVPVHVGNSEIPVWVSWIGVLVPSALAAWGFRSAGRA